MTRKSEQLILIKTRDFEIGVRERLARALVQDTGTGKHDGSDVVGGEEGTLITLHGQVRWQEDLFQVSYV